MESKRTILKRAMAKKYCGATRFDFLHKDEIPLIYRAMEIYARQMCESQKLTSENGKALDLQLLAAVPTDEEIMRAIHTATIVEPENGFQNAFIDKKFIAGFLTAVKWMQERH